MEKQMINKTSFTEVCKILKNKKGDICGCFNNIFEISLLFFPGLVNKEVGFIANAVNGATLLGAKPIIENAVKNISNVFTDKSYTDFSTKYDHAQIAQVLIVFAAYFDAMRLYLPDEERKIQITPEEKVILTNDSITAYISSLNENLSKAAGKTAKDIYAYDLSMPNPIERREDYLEKLGEFYRILNKEFLKFYEKLAFFDEMREEKRESFFATIRELPSKAVENYEKQYYQLAVNFHDFFIWTNIEEHKTIQKSLDVGFAEMSKLISDYFENSIDSKAKSTLEKYTIKYNSYIQTTVVDSAEMNIYSTDEIVFPEKSEIFVPQGFKALTYKNNMHLEDRAIWNLCEDREDIGKFVSDILRHSVTGYNPLLILGHPGAGKSLLCNMLAARILYHEYHVIIVKLRDTDADQSVARQINEQIERDFANGCLWSDIAESKLDKPILIIFDGYDELLQASGRAYSDYLQRIAEFQKQQRDYYGIFVKCIVTSRITLIDKAIISNDSPVIMLSDFDEKRIEQWCKIWNEKNKDYFVGSGISEFEIDNSSNVAELAKQPLLLLMLALYDSNGNALKRNKNLNCTQLYNSLIREFILREKRKDEDFRRRQLKEQDKLVDEEMIKISIAALGMYNRKILYIRSDELEKDLQFILQERDLCNDLKNNELSLSDKLLGSFFFIHKSNSTSTMNRERVLNVAYEFLHNTFGEFLTANYIVGELKNVLLWMHTLVQTNRTSQWKLSGQRGWVVCMAYAPLFSRPVVVEMIHEWAEGYFVNNNIDELNRDLDHLLDVELNSAINGNMIFDLKEVMDEKGNPFVHRELLKHLAIYSLNVVIIRTIIFNDKYNFRIEDERWRKLVHIWKYAFSDDELLSFANQFVTDKIDEFYQVSFNKEKESIFSAPVMKYMRINSAVGDSNSYGIAGALIGENCDKVSNTINVNELNIQARRLWNYCLNILTKDLYGQDRGLDIIFEIIKASWREGDIQYALCSYILMDELLKNKWVKIDVYCNRKVITSIVALVINMQQIRELGSKIILFTFDVASDILDYISLTDEDLYKLLNCFEDRYVRGCNLDMYPLKFVNKILKKAITYKKSYMLKKTLHQGRFIEEHMERMLLVIRNIVSKREEVITYFLEMMSDCLRLYKYAGNNRLARYYLEILDTIGSFNKRNVLLFEHKILIISITYNMLKKNILQKANFYMHWNKILYKINIRRIFTRAPEIFYELLVLINEGIIANESYITQEILRIVPNEGKDLSVSTLEQIKFYAENIGNDMLLNKLKQLISVIEK